MTERAKHSARGPWVVYRPEDRTYWNRGMWVTDLAKAQRMAKEWHPVRWLIPSCL